MASRWILVLISTLSLAAYASSYGYEEKCYARNRDPYIMFAQRTAYAYIHEKHAKEVQVPRCEPKQIWVLSRHGTSYPSKPTFQDMKMLVPLRDHILRNHHERYGTLCDEDLVNFVNWKLGMLESQESLLSYQGQDDVFLMAGRMKSRFPRLLETIYSRERFQFRFLDQPRTRASAENFARGLFGNTQPVYFPTPRKNDSLLNGYESCHSWQRGLAENRTQIEMLKFIQGPLMQGLISNVSHHLGFRYQLSYKQIATMYKMCAYDKAVNLKDLSPWCAAFNKEQLKILEYTNDLETYYKAGYGQSMNVQLGCPPIKDMIERFTRLAEGNTNEPLGVFHFTTDIMVAMTLAYMGIARDQIPLLAHNYDAMDSREWKSSKLMPFATNLAAVFYKCSEGEGNRVMFYLQEKLIDYEGCNNGLCSWENIKEIFYKTYSCNLDWCEYGWNSAPSSTTVSVLLIFLAFTMNLLILWHR